MAEEEMLNQNDPEKIMKKELAKKRAKVRDEFNVSRDEFSQWYVATVSPVVEWTNPVTAWMFAAWVHGSGVKEWISAEEKEKREARRVSVAAKKVAREAKEAAEKEVREAKKAEDAAARAEAAVKREAIKKDRLVINV